MPDPDLFAARDQLHRALQVLRARQCDPSADRATIEVLLTQCSLLDTGWHHVQKYCEDVRRMIGQADAVARAAKMGQVFYWLGEAASGARDMESCRTGLTDAVSQINWKPRAQRSPSEVPSAAALTSALTEACGAPIELLARQHNRFSSTFPSEILDTRWPDGTTRRMLAKYEFNRFRDMSGHRGGPAYESGVYRNVLHRLDLTRPSFWGSLDRGRGGGTWLFLEFLEGAMRPDDVASPREALRIAARWSAHFHNTAPRADCLISYDAAYFRQWAVRATQSAVPWFAHCRWLERFLEYAPDLVEELGSAPTNPIHGEFTPHNLLIRDGNIFPVDWESAAIGPGEIDLAALSDGWPREVAAACEREYVATRWPLGAPPDFRARLDLARAYWALRWLGNSPDAFPTLRMKQRLDALEPIARRLEAMVR